MTTAEQELNIAMCEWIGWEKNGQEFIKDGIKAFCPPIFCEKTLPNHIDSIESLGHVHEAEKGLDLSQRVDYMNMLAKVCGTQYEKPFATAKQRTIAILTVVNPEFIKTWKQKYPGE
jgi:hypothetical protein